MKLHTPIPDDEELTCETCRLGGAAHQNQVTYIVEWAPRNEPPAVLEGYEDAIDTFMAQRNSTHREARALPLPDENCTMLERQVIWGHNNHVGHLTDPVRKLLTVEHQAINPHTDIHPTGSYCIEIYLIAVSRRAMDNQAETSATLRRVNTDLMGAVLSR